MADAKVIIKSQNNISSGLNSAKKDVQSFSDSIESLGFNIKKILSTAAIGTAVGTLGKAVVEATKNFAEYERQVNQLKVALNNDQKAFNDTLKIVEKFSKITSSSKDEVLNMVSVLASLGKSTDEIEKITEASVALANVTGKDLNSSMEIMLDSLNGSVGEIEKYIPEVKNLTDEEKALGGAIDTVINKFGSLSKEMSSTSVSQSFKNIKDSFDSIGESLGSIISNTLSPVFSWMEEKLASIANTMKELKEESEDYQEAINNPSVLKFKDLLNAAQAEYSLNFIPYSDASRGSGAAYEYTKSLADPNYRLSAGDELPKNTELVNYLDNILKQDAVAFIELGETLKSIYRGGTLYDEVLLFLEGVSESYGGYDNLLANVARWTGLDNTYGTHEVKYGEKATLLPSINPDKNYNKEAIDLYASLKESTLDFVDSMSILAGGLEAEKEIALRNIQTQINEAIVAANGNDALIASIKETGQEYLDLTAQYYDEQIEEQKKSKESDYTKSINNSINSFVAVSDSYEELTRELYNTPSERQKALDKQFESFMTSLSTINKGDVESYNRLSNANDKALEAINEYFDTLEEKERAAEKEEQQNRIDAQWEGMLNSVTGSLGEFGNIVSTIITSLSAANPWITLLTYAVTELASRLSPFINEVINPLTDAISIIFDALANSLAPILQFLVPIMNVIEIALSSLAVVFQLLAPVVEIVGVVFELLKPIVQAVAAAFVVLMAPVEWLADLFSWLGSWLKWFGECIGVAAYNLTHWFSQKSMPSSPGGFSSDAFSNMYDRLDQIYNPTGSQLDTSTSTGVSNASYQGATSVTINIYQQAPVVGDNGMTEFAKMIRQEFEELAYFSA